MENDTVHYLTSIINLLQKKPEIQKIIDTHGLGQELTFGQIGFKNSGAFLRVYEILNSIEGSRNHTHTRIRIREDETILVPSGRSG